MDEVDRSVRFKALLEDRFLLILVVLVLVAAASGWWAFQVHAVPEYEEEQRIVDQWSEATAFSHSAEITRDGLLWDAGERVENRPIYYTNFTTQLDGNYTYTIDADRGRVDVTTEATLLIRSVDGEEVFWEYAEPLPVNVSDSIAAGETHSVTFSVDIEHVLSTINQIETELNAQQGLIDPRVRVHTQVDGEIEGEPLETTRRSDMPIVVTPETYRVGGTEVVDVQHQDTEVIRRPVDPAPLAAFGSLVGFLGAIFGLVLVAGGHVTGRFGVTERERELLEMAAQREEFDEWITTGRFPADREYEAIIRVDDLEGLVDVAIDTNNRVIEDTELGVGAVLDGDYVYVYVHPNSPAREWLTDYVDTTMEEFER